MSYCFRKVQISVPRRLKKSLVYTHDICEKMLNVKVMSCKIYDYRHHRRIDMEIIYLSTSDAWDRLKLLSKLLKADGLWIIIPHTSEAINLLEREIHELEQNSYGGKSNEGSDSEADRERIVRV